MADHGTISLTRNFRFEYNRRVITTSPRNGIRSAAVPSARKTQKTSFRWFPYIFRPSLRRLRESRLDHNFRGRQKTKQKNASPGIWPTPLTRGTKRKRKGETETKSSFPANCPRTRIPVCAPGLRTARWTRTVGETCPPFHKGGPLTNPQRTTARGCMPAKRPGENA